jgi:MFS family permease
MSNRQFGVLFLANLLFFGTGVGLVPLLPSYAGGLGATPTGVGLILAGAYVALAAGAMLTGRLARRIGGHRRLLVAASAPAPLLLILLGQVNSPAQLALLMSVMWACGGIVGALTSVLAGLYADPTHRGRVFGLLGLAMPVGATVCTLAIGAATTRLGFPAMFAILGLAWASLPPLAAGCLPADGPATAPGGAAGGRGAGPYIDAAFGRLLAATLLVSTAIFAGRLGSAYAMQGFGFGPGALTAATALGALIAAPLVPLAGALSDRIGRRGFLVGACAAAAAGMLLLLGASHLWHFALAATLFSAASYVIGSVAVALAGDLLPADALGRGLPLLGAVSWGAAIIGFAFGGRLLETLGLTGLSLPAATLALAAGLLVATLRPGTRLAARDAAGPPSLTSAIRDAA